MPQKGQKSVTLPEELVDKVTVIVKTYPFGFTSTTEFVKEAVREKIVRVTSDMDRPSPPSSPPPAPATIPPAGKPSEAASGDEGSSRGSGGRQSRSSATGTASPLSPTSGSARDARSPTSSTTVHAKAPAAEVDAREGGRDSGEVKLDREDAKTEVGVPARKKTVDLAKLEAHVLDATRAGLPRLLESGTETIFLTALVRRGYETQGIPDDQLPADDVALEFVRKLAPKSSVIARALKGER